MRKRIIHPMTRTDKLCALLLVGCFLAPHLAVMVLDEAACRAAEKTEVDNPQSVTVTTPTIDYADFLAAHKEAVEAVQDTTSAAREDPEAALDWKSGPLDQDCHEALREACEVSGVPVSLALGLIEVESGFQTDAVSSEGAYGLCQLNPKYFPPNLTPAENIQAGVAWPGNLLDRYGTPEAALTCYNAGYETGSRVYADAVLAAASRWEMMK